MNNNSITYNRKWLIISGIFVVISAIIYSFFWGKLKLILRDILEAQIVYSLFWITTVFIFLLHYFKHKNKEVKSEPIITKKFGIFFDNALGGIFYGTIITTSLTLLKGLYIQRFFTDIQYFKEFKDIDLLTIFGVACFLFYYALVKVVDVAKEIYKVEHTEKVMTENKVVVVPNKNMGKEINK